MSKSLKARRQQSEVRQDIDQRHRPGKGPKFNRYWNIWGPKTPEHLELQDEDLEILDELQAQHDRAQASLDAGKRPMKASAPGAPNWYGPLPEHEGSGCYARCAKGNCPKPECDGLSAIQRKILRRFRR